MVADVASARARLFMALAIGIVLGSTSLAGFDRGGATEPGIIPVQPDARIVVMTAPPVPIATDYASAGVASARGGTAHGLSTSGQSQFQFGAVFDDMIMVTPDRAGSSRAMTEDWLPAVVGTDVEPPPDGKAPARTTATPGSSVGLIASPVTTLLHEPVEVLGVATTAVLPQDSATELVTTDGVRSGSGALNTRAVGLVSAMNAVRLAEGLGPLVVAADLSRIARARSEDMVSNGYFAHVSPSGDSWISLLNRDGIRVKSGGENLARVAGDEERSVSVAILHLMESPTHRANILGRYTEVGVAAVTDEQGVTVFTAIFVAR
jgi:uncharacterized protein YkwD